MPSQIFNESAFRVIFPAAGIIRWNLDASRQDVLLELDDTVSGDNPPYRVNGGMITVRGRPASPEVKYSVCSSNSIFCNFATLDPLLVAQDDRGRAGQQANPLVIEFGQPVGAVGGYVGVGTIPGNTGELVIATMHVLLDTAPTWIPFSQNGHCGPPVVGGSPAAPFLGVQTGIGKIKSIAFDTISRAPFSQICLSNLLWAP